MSVYHPKNILFICTGNSVRSQMAEAFLNYYAGKFFNVYSAGVNPKALHPMTTKVMQERGFDLSDHYAKDVKTFLGYETFDTIITLSNEAAGYNLTRLPDINLHIHWLFDDPAAFIGPASEMETKFRAVRDQIEQKILEWLNQTLLQPHNLDEYYQTL